MKMEMFFYRNNQQKKLYKTGFVIKFPDIFAFFYWLSTKVIDHTLTVVTSIFRTFPCKNILEDRVMSLRGQMG